MTRSSLSIPDNERDHSGGGLLRVLYRVMPGQRPDFSVEKKGVDRAQGCPVHVGGWLGCFLLVQPIAQNPSCLHKVCRSVERLQKLELTSL